MAKDIYPPLNVRAQSFAWHTVALAKSIVRDSQPKASWRASMACLSMLFYEVSASLSKGALQDMVKYCQYRGSLDENRSIAIGLLFLSSCTIYMMPWQEPMSTIACSLTMSCY